MIIFKVNKGILKNASQASLFVIIILIILLFQTTEQLTLCQDLVCKKTDCVLKTKNDEELLFAAHPDGQIMLRLDVNAKCFWMPRSKRLSILFISCL